MPIESAAGSPKTTTREFRFGRVIALDRYVLSEVIGPFLGGIAFFLFVFLMFQILRLAEFFIVHGVAAKLLLKMVAMLLITFMPVALPIAFLIGVLVGFGRLSADSELVAMKASGFSIYRLSVPLVAFSVLVVGFSLTLNISWVPWAERTLKTDIIKVAKTKVVSSIREGAFTSGFFDLLVFADKVDNRTNRMQHVFIYDERDSKNPVAVVGREGEIINVKGQSEIASSILLRLKTGNIHRNNLDTKTYQKIDYDQYVLFLAVEEGDTDLVVKPKMLSYGTIKSELNSQTTTRERRRELRTELWRRYATAMSPFVFVFLGIGLGTIRTRSVRASASIIVFGTIFVYWLLQTGMTVVSTGGYLPPFIAMNLPNLLLAIPAVIFYRRSAW